MSAPDPDLDDLAAALELLALPYADQRALLPPDGYSEAGVMNECVEGLRDAMARVPGLMGRGLLSADAAACAAECHLQMEKLLQVADTATARAFSSDANWRQLRALAALAAAAVRSGPS